MEGVTFDHRIINYTVLDVYWSLLILCV